MALIYAADLWCDSCGRAIRRQIRREGQAPHDPNDDFAFDSDDYPKFVGDAGEADCPQHCGRVTIVSKPSNFRRAGRSVPCSQPT